MSERVENWMTTPVIGVPPNTSLNEAAALMAEHRVRRLAVLDEGELVGVLSLGDVRAAQATATMHNQPAPEAPVVQVIMTRDPITIPYSASLGLAAQTMLELKVSGLPVIDDDGALCGLLSESDLFRYIVKSAA